MSSISTTTASGCSVSWVWQNRSPSPGSENSQELSPRKVNEATAGIGAQQFNLQAIADVQPALALHQHAIHVRIQCAHKRTVLVHPGHNRAELRTDPIRQRHSRNPLLHIARQLALRGSLCRAVRG